MLWFVLALVAAAFGLLVTALTSGAMLWAWLSVAASAVAAVVLIIDWSRRRSLARSAPDDAGPLAIDLDPDPPLADDAPAPEPPPAAQPARPVAAIEVDPDEEPPEEDTDAADVLTVSDSTLEVRVVDERPRYHLKSCPWLATRPTLPLPVREARELGFTPCAVCTPDRTLAAKARPHLPT